MEAPRVGDGADELAVNIDGAAAHAGDDTAVVLHHRAVDDAGEDLVTAQIGVSQDAEDFEVELLDLDAVEHAAADGLVAGADLIGAQHGVRIELELC